MSQGGRRRHAIRMWMTAFYAGYGCSIRSAEPINNRRSGAGTWAESSSGWIRSWFDAAGPSAMRLIGMSNTIGHTFKETYRPIAEQPCVWPGSSTKGRCRCCARWSGWAGADQDRVFRKVRSEMGLAMRAGGSRGSARANSTRPTRLSTMGLLLAENTAGKASILSIQSQNAESGATAAGSTIHFTRYKRPRSLVGL